ncbi:hypothetical protein J3R82DRAFT_9010 [Butyriboletus roseoflavus]|nr:hypothetical protein J3R82DRAFT_9010 [Butyriboletus roseoflavus]
MRLKPSLFTPQGTSSPINSVESFSPRTTTIDSALHFKRNIMDFGLKDVHVLVTGASGGIGLETAKLYCSLGAEVTAHYNTQYGPLESLSNAYANLQAVQADLSDETSVANMFTAIAHAGRPVADLTLQRWNHTISTNLTSSFLVCREYLKRLRSATSDVKEKAAIVLIGSTAGKYGEAGHADYAVTKSAMMYGLTMSLKNEIVKIAPKGRVNTVAPGWVRTLMAESALADPNVVYRALATTPLKKVATPLDIANQIVVLSSSTVSGHVTGQVVMVEADTPFEDGTFKLLLTFDESYPNKPPTVKFLSRMFHPNVYANGELCLDILQNRWSPTYDVAAILTSIQSLLHDPNPNSPANAEAAQLYRENMKEYVRRVKATVEDSWLDPEERQKMQVDEGGAV